MSNHDQTPAAPSSAPLALLESPGIDDLLARFLSRRKQSTIEAYRKDMTYFAAWLGLELPAAVARLLACNQGQANRLVDHYLAHMRNTVPAARSASTAAHLSPATVNRRLAALKSLIRMARLHGMVAWTIDVDGERVEPYRDTSGPGLQVVRQMVSHLDEAEGRQQPKAARDRALLRLMWDLGLRRGEIVELDLGHLDRSNARLSILGKGRQTRQWLALPTETMEALDLWLTHRGAQAGALFTSVHRHGQVRQTRIGASDIYRLVANCGAEAGAKQVSPHRIRHSSITAVLEASGGDRRLGQTHGRHKDSRVTDGYDDNRKKLGPKAARLAASLL